MWSTVYHPMGGGFCWDVLEEKSQKWKDIMICYLGDLTEDATDFTWQGAKTSYAVLLCDMERGSLKWENTDRIYRTKCVHAQKHVLDPKTGW